MSFELLQQEIIDKDLCEGCGLCAGFCKAISLENGKPVLTGKCVLTKQGKSCGLCYELCPQAHPESVSTDSLKPLGSASFRTRNKTLLSVASDGGFVTTLLRHLLKTKEYKAVVAVTGEKREPVPLTVTEPKEVKRLGGTRYSPSGVMNEFGLSFREHGSQIVVVGLPCELRGVKRLEQRLGVQVLKIGLFCSNNNKTGDDGKVVKLGSCEHCQDFFGLNADLSCGFAGSEKGWTSVIALTEKGKGVLDSIRKTNLFEVGEVDMEKIERSQVRKSKRELANPAHILRERVLEELEAAGESEIEDLAERLGVRPDDIYYHLLILQLNGSVKSREKDQYSVIWSVA
ncbi:MAG: Coenzyme F420 hydrogenase/dehydrogenase, beta subunit C-terminal domain [Candidatus Thorarchaeota archaeon]